LYACPRSVDADTFRWISGLADEVYLRLTEDFISGIGAWLVLSRPGRKGQLLASVENKHPKAEILHVQIECTPMIHRLLGSRRIFAFWKAMAG